MQRRERSPPSAMRHSAGDNDKKIDPRRLIQAQATPSLDLPASLPCAPAVSIAARPDLINAIIRAAQGCAPVRSSELRACLHGVGCLSLGEMPKPSIRSPSGSGSTRYGDPCLFT